MIGSTRGAVTLILVVTFSLSVFAQTKAAAAAYKPAPTLPLQLNLTLADLTRVASRTNQDLASFHHSRKFHWVAFWHKDSDQHSQVATALRRNLQFAVPNLIHDAQLSGGSISTTFKLYKDLSVVSESLDSLIPPGSREGHDVAALNNDLSEMNRIKEELSSYIQQTAMSIESKNPQLVLSSGSFPKKIIIDDTTPEKPTKKRRSSSQ
jgi:hypothetical protein